MVFEELSDDDLLTALNEVVSCVGVRDEEPLADFLQFLERSDAHGCAQEISARLGLPVHISLSSLEAGNAEGFGSVLLAPRGRPQQSIAARIEMPQHPPMIGTQGLQGYPVRIRVSSNCYQSPETFVAVLAHELSHLLLACLYHPKGDSELYVDLVPIALGFRDIIRRGRKVTRGIMDGTLGSTQTTTYGYLTDSQFEYACDHVEAILQAHRKSYDHLAEVLAQVQRKLRVVTRRLTAFNRYLKHLDRHPVGRMKEADARHMVRYHDTGYCRDWNADIMSTRTAVQDARLSARNPNRYTHEEADLMQGHIQAIELACQRLNAVDSSIREDLKILRHYVPLLRRLQVWVSIHRVRD
jgi:hypothetical protein